MKILTLEQHRARIDNINSAEKGNKKYFKRHRVHEYLPGQAVYNLGDYPKRFSIEPTEYDYNLLKDMAENGVQLIQLHEEWNDSIRHLGADKFSSFDPEGLQKFVDLCHYFGIKIIPYVSSGFFHVYDPDYQKEFAIRDRYCLNGLYFKYQTCSASSAEWRNYMIPRTFAILDKYGFDGIYNDWGQDSNYTKDGLLERNGQMPYDPEEEDMLSMIYSEVKRRGGIYKLHCSYNDAPPCLSKVYDYLWIGETVKESIPGMGKEYPDYVVPCPDFGYNVDGSYEYQLARMIPFLQFPLLTRGRPLYGGTVEEDVPYYKTEEGTQPAFDFFKRVGEYMRENPDGPYVYSGWSSIPDNPENYPTWSKYMKLYKPMVEENSLAFIELRESDDITSAIPEKVYASMFVNEETYLVVSNFTGADYKLELRDSWTDRVSGVKGKSFTVPNERILFLIKNRAIIK